MIRIPSPDGKDHPDAENPSGRVEFLSHYDHLDAEDFKPTITRAWVVKMILLYAAFLAGVWYVGWRYLGSGMTH